MASDSIVAETATRIFRDLCDPQTVTSAADERWKGPAWTQLEEAGLTLAWVPAELGGAGADLADGFAILRQTGRFAVPLPIAETLLAGWLLARANISSPRGAMACTARAGHPVSLTANGSLSGRLRAVPFGRAARHLALLARRESGDWAVVLVETGAARIVDGSSLAGDPLDAVTLDGIRPVAVKDAPAGLHDAVMLMGATMRAMQMAGALEAILDAAVTYANERVAFERPIAKFQAVQHNLARLAGETAVAMAAAGSAADALASSSAVPRGEEDLAVFLEAAAAKIRVGEAAGEGAAIAHQVLGAIGFTKEHTLHRFTQRLWTWRDDFGSESHWAVQLGRHVAANGADALWPMLAAR
ncbi:MAG: acyl-CoA/acyl-ACP dehydrogenase [Hyphomonadaceae bacterium]|nr:acyl-CoA/acyl-ACP dehydrogenase [Hyphomonadaceae bacterium]